MRDRCPITIPEGTVEWVTVTCCSHFSQSSGAALIEPLDGGQSLPECVLISPAMVMVTKVQRT